MSRRKSKDVQRLETILEKITTGEDGGDNSENALNQFKECADLESLINRLIKCTNLAEAALKDITKVFALPNYPEIKFIKVEAGSKAKDIYKKLLAYETKNEEHQQILGKICKALEQVKRSFWVPVVDSSLINQCIHVTNDQLKPKFRNYEYDYGNIHEFFLFLGTIALGLMDEGWHIADAINKSVDTYALIMEREIFDEDDDENSSELYIMSTSTFDFFNYNLYKLVYTKVLPPEFPNHDGTYEYPNRYRDYGWLILR